MKRTLRTLGLVCMALLLCTNAHAQEDYTEKLKIGDDLPQFTLRSKQYGDISTSDLTGKVTLIVLFATWCGPCQGELAHINSELYPRFKDNPDFRLLVIGREHTEEELKEYNKKKKFLFPLYPDPTREVYTFFADKYIPRTYLFGKDGKLIACFGYPQTDGMISRIEDALK